MQYRPEIDGLRAVAVITVILFHAGLETFSGGFVGVDVFFVISGYLITTIIVSELDAGTFTLRSFYERRARRILPALFLVIVFCIPVAWLTLTPNDMKDFAQSVFAAATFSSNILFWRESGYFATTADLKPLLHTWSLAVEEQYYILFPLFMIVAWRYFQAFVPALLALVFILSFGFSQYAAYNHPAANFYLLPTRGWELLLGVLTALYIDRMRLSNRFSSVISYLGAGLIATAVLTFSEETPFPSAYALLPTVGTGLIIIGCREKNLLTQLLRISLFVKIGVLSYSLYLWHQPILAFFRYNQYGQLSFTSVTSALVITAFLSFFTYILVEGPLRRQRLSPIFLGVIASVGIFLCGLGLGGHFSDGYKEFRFDEEEVALFDTAQPSPLRSDCHYGKNDSFTAEESCTYHAEPVTWAVFGNSHGVELAYAFAQVLEEKKIGLRHFTISGCHSSFGRSISPYCDDFFADRVRFLERSDQLRNVLLAFRQEHGTSADADSVIRLANHLAGVGKNVILVLQAPILPTSINHYLVKGMQQKSVAAREKAEWEAMFQHVSQSVDQLDENVAVVDLQNAFCDTEHCYAIRDSAALFFDDDHMSVAGARLASRLIVRSDSVREILSAKD